MPKKRIRCLETQRRGYLKTNKTVIVSACLLGISSRYNGKSLRRAGLIKSLKGMNIVPVCPEQLGGLSTPRSSSEIKKGDGKDVLDKRTTVLDENGKDVTKNFVKGARETLKIARLVGARRAILKDKSPSCGVNTIMRKGRTIKGEGVSAAFLKRKGIAVEGV